MRSILDYQAEPEYSKLKGCVQSNVKDPLVEDLVDYLNFFQFIAVLVEMEQLSHDEVKKIFKYYLENLTKSDFVVRFVKNEGFGSLYKLLKDLKLLNSTMD